MTRRELLRQAVQATAAAATLPIAEARVVDGDRRPRLAVLRLHQHITMEQRDCCRDMLTRMLAEAGLADVRVAVLDAGSTLAFYDDRGQRVDEALDADA